MLSDVVRPSFDLKSREGARGVQVMWGDSESASKNTSDPIILKIRKERFLIFPLACDVVLVLAVARVKSEK